MALHKLLIIGLSLSLVAATGSHHKPQSGISSGTPTTSAASEPTCTNAVGKWPPSLPTDVESKPKNFGIVVFRGFQMLDAYGPLDALGFLNRMSHVNLHILSDTLDPVTTQPMVGSMNPYNSSFYPTIQPTSTFKNAPDIDVLIVPGGLGTRSPYIQEHIDYIAKVYPSLQYIITVCTGAILAAKSGILDGKKATTNKNAFATVVATGPNTTWIPHARWVVDGNIWTASGVSAGIDVTLAWINHVYGTENATMIANWMEYEAHKDPSWDPFADIFNVTENNLSEQRQKLIIV